MNNFLNNFNDDFDEIVEGFFGKPRHLIFNSTVKDLYPTSWKKNDEGDYTCTIKTLGIDPQDLNVEQTEWGLKIKGETKIKEDTYNTSMELPIANSIMNDIDKIQVKSKDGLTFITLMLNKQSKKKIKIEIE